jgi:hypothetical protein
MGVDSGRLRDLDKAGFQRYRCSVPATTMSTWRPPHCAQMSHSRHSGTGVSGPHRSAVSAATGSA